MTKPLYTVKEACQMVRNCKSNDEWKSIQPIMQNLGFDNYHQQLINRELIFMVNNDWDYEKRIKNYPDDLDKYLE